MVKQERKKRQRYQKASDLTGIASDGWGAAALIGHSPGQDPGRSVLALGLCGDGLAEYLTKSYTFVQNSENCTQNWEKCTTYKVYLN